MARGYSFQIILHNRVQYLLKFAFTISNGRWSYLINFGFIYLISYRADIFKTFTEKIITIIYSERWMTRFIRHINFITSSSITSSISILLWMLQYFLHKFPNSGKLLGYFELIKSYCSIKALQISLTFILFIVVELVCSGCWHLWGAFQYLP